MKTVFNNEAEVVIADMEAKARSLKTVRGQLSPEANYALACCHFARLNYQQARLYCETLLEQVQDDPALRARALLLKGRINLNHRGYLVDADIRDFADAYQSGNPEAGRFFMLGKMGHYGTLCVVAWVDPLEMVNIAERLAGQHNKYLKEVAGEKVRAVDSGNEHRALMCDMVSAFETTGQKQERLDFATWFPLLLCEMFEFPDDKQADVDKEVEVALRLYERRGGEVENYRAIYLYARMRRSGYSEEMLQKLLALPIEIAYLLAGDILLKGTEANRELGMHCLEQVRSQPMAFDLRIEALLAKHRIREALAVCHEACQQMRGYLAGEQKLFGLVQGEQSAELKSHGPQWADVVELAELHAVNAMLERFTNKAELLQEAVDEQDREAALKKSVKQTFSSSEKTETTGQTRGETPVTTTPEPEKTAEVPDVQVQETEPVAQASVTVPVTASKKMPAAHVDYRMQSVINQANDLIRDQSELDRAEEMLLKLKPEKGSLMWFRQQQSLCWVYHEQGVSYDYLFRKIMPGQRACDLGMRYLERADKQGRQLIKELVKQAEAEVPELAAGAASGRLYQQPEKFMAVAEALDRRGAGFRRMYGGLYSLLGHVHKAYLDNPASGWSDSDAVRKGVVYYQIANRIRGYV